MVDYDRRPSFWRDQWPVVLIAAVWLAINLTVLYMGEQN